MKLISAALSSLALVSGSEFDDGSPSLLQLAKRHDASPSIGHEKDAHGHHYGYNATKKLSGGNFGCTGQESTPGDMLSCGLWGDVHQHLKFGGGGAANSNGVGWYWLAKSKDDKFQAQAFYRQNGGWTTMSHLVFKFGDQVLFLDRDLKADNSDGRSESWLWTYYWRDYPSGQPVEKSVNDAPCDVGDVYWANRGGGGHFANQGDFSSFNNRAPIRNNCFEYRPSMVSVWVTYQTWQANSMGPYGGGIVMELEGSETYLDRNFGQCAFAQQQVQPDDMLVTISQNEKVCDDNKLDRSQCTNPPPLPPAPPTEPTAQDMCNTAAQGNAADGAARYEHAQALCGGQPAGDVYESCVYDVCASFDAAAEKLAVGGAALEAAMANDRAVCAITNAFQNAANCMPCDICSKAPEVNLRHVTQNNLGGVGPDSGAEEIRYSNAICLGGTLVYPGDGSAPSCPDGRLLDVALTAIPEPGQSYDLIASKASKNGNNGKEPEPFGRFLINSGLECNMKFEFQDSATGEAVAVPDITITFYDMDEAEQQYGTALGPAGHRVQRETVTACKADQIYVTDNTELLQTTTGLCNAFQSNVVGTGQDNPKTPDTLTKTQADRSVTFEFHQKSHIIWTATVTAGANTPRPILWGFRPQVACGASDSESKCADIPDWTTAVSITGTGTEVETDLGQGAFNAMFNACPVVRYTRNGAVSSIYVRKGGRAGVNGYSLMTYLWSSTNNVKGTDFDIYSNEADAWSGANPWPFCNFNDPDVGYPRDCGASGYIANTWFSMPSSGQNDAANGGGPQRFDARGLSSGASFDIYTGPNCPTQPYLWTMAVQLTGTGTTVATDIGQAAFNTLFDNCPVVKYTRNGAVSSVYVRKANRAGVDAYSLFTYTWVNADNVRGTDFDIYSSEADAMSGSNPWPFCNYNDPDVGYPRDCGPGGAVGNTWFSMPSSGQNDAANGGGNQRFDARGLSSGSSFEIYTGPNCPGR